jgi:hypothetical protein
MCGVIRMKVLDTDSYRVVNVKEDATGIMEAHPFRVWHESNLETRYKAFLESTVYATFQQAYIKKTIGKERPLQVCKKSRAPIMC